MLRSFRKLVFALAVTGLVLVPTTSEANPKGGGRSGGGNSGSRSSGGSFRPSGGSMGNSFKPSGSSFKPSGTTFNPAGSLKPQSLPKLSQGMQNGSTMPKIGQKPNLPQTGSGSLASRVQQQLGNVQGSKLGSQLNGIAKGGMNQLQGGLKVPQSNGTFAGKQFAPKFGQQGQFASKSFHHGGFCGTGFGGWNHGNCFHGGWGGKWCGTGFGGGWCGTGFGGTWWGVGCWNPGWNHCHWNACWHPHWHSCYTPCYASCWYPVTYCQPLVYAQPVVCYEPVVCYQPVTVCTYAQPVCTTTVVSYTTCEPTVVVHSPAPVEQPTFVVPSSPVQQNQVPVRPMDSVPAPITASAGN